MSTTVLLTAGAVCATIPTGALRMRPDEDDGVTPDYAVVMFYDESGPKSPQGEFNQNTGYFNPGLPPDHILNLQALARYQRDYDEQAALRQRAREAGVWARIIRLFVHVERPGGAFLPIIPPVAPMPRDWSIKTLRRFPSLAQIDHATASLADANIEKGNIHGYIDRSGSMVFDDLLPGIEQWRVGIPVGQLRTSDQEEWVHLSTLWLTVLVDRLIG
jgi:hypothetical protein